MIIRAISDEEKDKYRQLLLEGDEDWNMVERYLRRGSMFALYDDSVRTIAVVTKESPDVFELKNIATEEHSRGKGYGKAMLEFIVSYCRDKGVRELLVGTGDNPRTIGFYESCGFKRSHIKKNFFKDNYDHVIIEDGIVLCDMVYLKMTL